MKIFEKIINKIVDKRIEELENRIFKKKKDTYKSFTDIYSDMLPYFKVNWGYEPKTLEEEITDYGEKIDAIAKFLKVEFKTRPSKEEELVVKKIKKTKKTK